MNILLHLLSTPYAMRLGLVLLHFVWQGAAIALCLAATFLFFRRATSKARYLLAGAALCACALAPVATWTFLAATELAATLGTSTIQDTASPVSAPLVQPPSKLRPDTSQSEQTFEPAAWNPAALARSALPSVVAAWFAGVLCLSLRLFAGAIFLRRLRQSGTPLADANILRRSNELLQRMRISRPVRLLVSALVEVPTLIGCLWPVILVPASVLANLTPEQLEAVLAHELAHVRRWDYLMNLLQTLVETALFYHPAMWWISHLLREERENCCDDLALKFTRDRLTYARALALLEENRTASLALAATGGSLLRRIQRLAGIPERRRQGLPLAALFVVALALLIADRESMAGAPSTSSSSVLPATATQSTLDAQRKHAYANALNPSPPLTESTVADGPHAKRARIMAKLHSIIIDKIDFTQLDIADVIQALTEKSKQFDPEHHGINFVLNLETPTHAISPAGAPAEPLHRQVTIKLGNVSLYDVLVSIVRQTTLQFAIDDYAVYLRPAEVPDPNLTVRAFLAPPGFLSSSEFSGIAPSLGPDHRPTDDPLDHDVKEELIARGIRFPAGATAVLLGGSGKLIVRNTPEQLDLLGSLIEKENESTQLPGSKTASEKDGVSSTPPPHDISIGSLALNPPPALTADAPTLGNIPWPPMTRIALKIVAIDERDYENHRNQIDADLERGDITRIAQFRSFDLLSEPTALIKPGEHATLEAVRVFPIPVAFERVSGKLTPTNFERKDVGVRFETSTDTKNGVIEVTGKLSLTSFEGWTRTGEKAFSPTFRTCESYLFDELTDGQTKGICVPGLQTDRADGNLDLDMGKIEAPNRPPSRILIFLNARTVGPGGFDTPRLPPEDAAH